MKRTDVDALQQKLQVALEKQRHDAAVELYEELARAERKEPRWPHRKGDLLRRMGRKAEAVSAYERAIELYAAQGFVARAAAVVKLALEVDPARTDLLDRIETDTARKLHRERTSLVHPPPVPGAPPAPPMQAAPLVRAPDAAPDEVRFSDAAAPVEIDLSELEVVVEIEEEPTPERLAALPAIALFAEVPREVLHKLVQHATLVRRDAGERVLAAGEPADAMFVVVEGAVRVRVPGVESAIVLAEGEVFGEGCLLEHATRRADVLAERDLLAMRVEKQFLDDLVLEHPEVEAVLFQLLSRRLLANLLQTSILFRGFDPPHRLAVARLFESRRAMEGTRIAERGKKSDGLYVLLTGKLFAQDEGRNATLGPGAIVGQRALLTRAAAPSTLIAATDVVLLRLPSSRVNELAIEFPDVLAHLSDLGAGAADVIEDEVAG